MNTFVTVELGFEAAHYLKNPIFSEKENESHYGKCQNMHGHNYKLFVTVHGIVEQDGMVVNFRELKKIIKERIIEIYDHKLTNDLLDDVPTAENMVVEFWKQLESEIQNLGKELYEIKLYETDTSYVVIRK